MSTSTSTSTSTSKNPNQAGEAEEYKPKHQRCPNDCKPVSSMIHREVSAPTHRRRDMECNTCGIKWIQLSY